MTVALMWVQVSNLNKMHFVTFMHFVTRVISSGSRFISNVQGTFYVYQRHYVQNVKYVFLLE